MFEHLCVCTMDYYHAAACTIWFYIKDSTVKFTTVVVTTQAVINQQQSEIDVSLIVTDNHE